MGEATWTDQTRRAVAVEFDCGVCLDFGWLPGLGPCPHCHPDAFTEHVLACQDTGEVVA